LTSRMSQGARSCTCHSRSPPTAPGKIPMVYRKRQAIAACHREIVRSQTLKAELRVEFEKTQSALEVTRTNLARMRKLAPPQCSPQPQAVGVHQRWLAGSVPRQHTGHRGGRPPAASRVFLLQELARAGPLLPEASGPLSLSCVNDHRQVLHQTDPFGVRCDEQFPESVLYDGHHRIYRSYRRKRCLGDVLASILPSAYGSFGAITQWARHNRR
jgi:hypothetical protein